MSEEIDLEDEALTSPLADAIRAHVDTSIRELLALEVPKYVALAAKPPPEAKVIMREIPPSQVNVAPAKVILQAIPPAQVVINFDEKKLAAALKVALSAAPAAKIEFRETVNAPPVVQNMNPPVTVNLDAEAIGKAIASAINKSIKIEFPARKPVRVSFDYSEGRMTGATIVPVG